MNSLIGTSFPTIFVPEKSKDESYHRSFAQAIISRSVMGGYNVRYSLFNECVNYYMGLQQGEEFEFLQRAEDGEVLPAKWMDFNKIAPKVHLLIGELIRKNYRIQVQARNKEAQSRRMDERNRLITEMRFQPIAQELEQHFGMPIQQEGFVPQSQPELDIYMNKTYKETSEIVMRSMLNYLREVDGWDYQRIALYRDLIVMGCCFARSEIIDGMPHMERKDPRYMIFDINAKDDFLSDSTFWGEVQYMSIGEITKIYDITEAELRAAYKSYTDFYTNQTYFSAYSQDFGFLDQSSKLSIFKNDGGELRIMVGKVYWQDYHVMQHKYSEDKFGQTHIKQIKYDPKDTLNTKDTTMMIWRKGTLIGGKFLKDWGILENQERSVDNIATTTPPYIALIPNYYNNAIVSVVNRLRPLQNLKNIIMYNVQLQIATSGGKGFFYDISQLPKGWDLHTAIKYLRTAKIGFIDSSVEGAGPYNQFKEFDMGISDSVTKFLELCHFLDGEMDQISGVNEARQGTAMGASQAVGVTNSMLVQSNLSTEIYSDLFSKFFTKILNKQAGLGKIAWAGKERFSPIIGDVGVNFLEKDIELDLNDYDVFVDDVPQALQDQQMLQNLVSTAVQQQQVTLLQALKILNEKDIDDAIIMMEQELEQTQEMHKQQQQDMMQQQQEQLQAQQQTEQGKVQMQLQKAQMKEQGSLQKVLMQGKLDTQKNILGFQQNVALKEIELAIQKQKAKEKDNKAKSRSKK